MAARRSQRKSVHQRTPAPRGRRAAGIKTGRRGYPALFLGQAAATKTLAEIAHLEPVAIEALPERSLVTAQNLGFTTRRLVAVGLVQRYHVDGRRDRYRLMLARRSPWSDELRAVLKCVGPPRKRWPEPPKQLSESLAVLEGPRVTGLRIFGRPAGDIETIFGSPQRTVALLLVSSIGAVDASTIARVCNVRTDGDMHRLLDPIEADGIFVSRMVGSIRLYSLPARRWAEPLRQLTRAILENHPILASRVSSGQRLMLSGSFSGRVHLRRQLGLS